MPGSRRAWPPASTTMWRRPGWQATGTRASWLPVLGRDFPVTPFTKRAVTAASGSVITVSAEVAAIRAVAHGCERLRACGRWPLVWYGEAMVDVAAGWLRYTLDGSVPVRRYSGYGHGFDAGQGRRRRARSTARGSRRGADHRYPARLRPQAPEPVDLYASIPPAGAFSVHTDSAS
jgi:hypothetical protein